MMSKDFLTRSIFLKIIGLLAFAVGLNWLLQHYELLASLLAGLMSLLSPLLMGAAIAFILNIPMRLIEHLVFRKPYVVPFSVYPADAAQPETSLSTGAAATAQTESAKSTGAAGTFQPVTAKADDAKKSAKNHPAKRTLAQTKQNLIKPVHQIVEKIKMVSPATRRSFFIRTRDAMSRPVSLILSIILVLGLTAAVMILVIPELINSIQILATSLPEFLITAQKWLQAQLAVFPELSGLTSSFQIDWQKIGEAAASWLKGGAGSIFDSTYKFATIVFGGVFNAILALIFAIYILFQKESLSRQARILLKAFVPDRWVGEIERIAALTNQTFNRFIAGQFIEAVILGLLFLVAMSIFRFPYVVLISVLIAFTALIPMIGSLIGCAIGVFMILIVSPIQAFWFLILFLILQQIENNVIYPRVVGGSIGLPGIWVLLAVLIGGSLFGVVGILLFIPLCSVLYVLMREYVYKRVKNKPV